MKTYKYVDGEYVIKNEIKKSIFIATVKGEVDEDSAEEFVKSIKKKYSDATHNCYAYISDINSNATRFSDDGEPSGTAGGPILEVIKKQGLVRTAVVVTRYFGGIKLGAGGLVGAYTGAAVDGINAAMVSTKKESSKIVLETDYSTFSQIDKLLRKAECLVENVEYGDNVKAYVYVPLDEENNLLSKINESSQGKCNVQKDENSYYIKY